MSKIAIGLQQNRNHIKYGKEETGGVEHVPVGYDRWGIKNHVNLIDSDLFLKL